MWNILVVDDEEGIRSFVATALKNSGYHVTAAADGQEALDLFHQNNYHLIISDLKMPRMDGLTLLRQVKSESPETEVVLLTAFGTIDNAVEAMKLGAFDYLTKPINSLEELRLLVARALERRQFNDLRAVDRERSQEVGKLDYTSKKMGDLVTDLQKVAPTDSSVLLIGESGTGKEVLANYIHNLSQRQEAPFVAVNCAALSEQLLESELFGHEKGSFTGAIQNRRGRFELADGGTIFLDEISELKPNLQAKLLRVLQEREFERVGGSKTIKVDVRIISATNRDLAQEIKNGSFRLDLYHRLATFPVRIPPLRERPEDIPVIAAALLQQIGRNLKKNNLQLSEASVAALLEYTWPGNIRELANVLERAAILSSENTIHARQLLFGIPDIATGEAPGLPSDGNDIMPSQLPVNLKELEKLAISRALQQNGGKRKESSEALGIGLRTLYEKLKEYNLA